MSKTLDDSTKAAISGKLNLSLDQYSTYFEVNRRLVHLAKCSPWFLKNLPIFGKYVFHLNHIFEHLAQGCLIPVKVISLEDNLVAGFSSLTAMGDTPTPIIKVWKERLDLIQGKPPHEGAYYAASATFYRTDESWQKGCWSDVSPYVINCLVDDPKACDSAKQQLKDLAWEALDIGVGLLPSHKEGLHYVDIPHEIAWNAY